MSVHARGRVVVPTELQAYVGPFTATVLILGSDSTMRTLTVTGQVVAPKGPAPG